MTSPDQQPLTFLHGFAASSFFGWSETMPSHIVRLSFALILITCFGSAAGAQSSPPAAGPATPEVVSGGYVIINPLISV